MQGGAHSPATDRLPLPTILTQGGWCHLVQTLNSVAGLGSASNPGKGGEGKGTSPEMCWWWLAPMSQAKVGLCQWPWGLWETQTGTSPEGQRPVSPWGGIKGSQNAYGAQGQEELLWHRPGWVALQFLLPTADVTSGWDMAAVVSPLALPPSWAQASQQF